MDTVTVMQVLAALSIKACLFPCELLRLIEVGASCFNHYCAGYDDT
jgi:hypothetical protein